MKNKLISIVLIVFASVSLIAGCTESDTESEPTTQAETEIAQTEPEKYDNRTIIKEFNTDNIFGLKGIYTEENTIIITFDIKASQAYSDESINMYSCLKNNKEFYITLGITDGTIYLIRDFEVFEDDDCISISLIPQVDLSFSDISWININSHMIQTNGYRLIYTRFCGEEETQYNQSYNESTDSWRELETTITVLE